jgi:hypothetical protein
MAIGIGRHSSPCTLHPTSNLATLALASLLSISIPYPLSILFFSQSKCKEPYSAAAASSQQTVLSLIFQPIKKCDKLQDGRTFAD